MSQVTFFTVLDALSHDLKSPVASMLSVLSLIGLKKERITSAELTEYINRAEQRGRFLNENIDALFAVAALLEDKLELSTEPVPVAALVAELQVYGVTLPAPASLTGRYITADEAWLFKGLRSVVEHVQRLAEPATQIQWQITADTEQLQLRGSFSGSALFASSVTAEPITKLPADPFALEFFLGRINKVVRLSLFVAVEVLRKMGGDVQLLSEDAQQQWLITLPIRE